MESFEWHEGRRERLHLALISIDGKCNQLFFSVLFLGWIGQPAGGLQIDLSRRKNARYANQRYYDDRTLASYRVDDGEKKESLE